MGYASNDAEKIKFALVNGAAANTELTVTGISVKDKLISVIGHKVASGVLTVSDFTSNFVISATNKIKAATTDTTNFFLQVVYLDQDAG